MSNPSDASQNGESTSANALDERIATVFGRIADTMVLVERAMREQLEGPAELIPLLGDHVLASGGKRMRPALLVLCAELCGYTGPRRVQLAAAIELLHTATLLHDDVVDMADLRRGRPSANAIWGNRRAVLGGDFFYARCSSMIVEDGNPHVLGIFADAIRGMAEGELLQLQRSFDDSVTEAHYFQVIERKSATLLSAACEVGAILGGVTRGEQRRVRGFGRELGVAFQLRDDALDYEADFEDMGKRPLADVREGKVTLPLILTLKRCTHAERQQIGAVLKTAARLSDDFIGATLPTHAPNATPSSSAEPADAAMQALGELDLSSVVELVDRYRGVSDTVRRAHEHIERAADAIAAFPDGEAKSALLAAADYVVRRDR